MKKKGVIVILDLDQRIRNQVEYLKTKMKFLSAPTMTAVVRAAVNQIYEKYKNPK